MIRPLRVRHRRLLPVLSILIMVIFVLGLAARRGVPRSGEVAALTPVASLEGFVVVSEDQGAWIGLPVKTIWLHDPDPLQRLAVTLEVHEELKRADVLLYWSASGAGNEQLPADARLLGRVGDRPRGSWILPAAAGTTGGHLILYSLAKHEMLAMTAVPLALREAGAPSP